MHPRIELLAEKLLVGNSIEMCLSDNKTGELWSLVAPRIKEIRHRTSADKISMQIYPQAFYRKFDPHTLFTKWATVEVNNRDKIPDGLQVFVLEGGLYAVFEYRGSSTDQSIYRYIFSEWLPGSIYEVDDRPHFEVLGLNYRNNDPDSEEEIWVPIKKRR